MSKGNPKRGIRMDDDFWAEVQAGCTKEGTNPSELVRGLLRGWLDGKRDNDKQGEPNE